MDIIWFAGGYIFLGLLFTWALCAASGKELQSQFEQDRARIRRDAAR